MLHALPPQPIPIGAPPLPPQIKEPLPTDLDCAVGMLQSVGEWLDGSDLGAGCELCWTWVGRVVQGRASQEWVLRLVAQQTGCPPSCPCSIWEAAWFSFLCRHHRPADERPNKGQLIERELCSLRSLICRRCQPADGRPDAGQLLPILNHAPLASSLFCRCRRPAHGRPVCAAEGGVSFRSAALRPRPGGELGLAVIGLRRVGYNRQGSPGRNRKAGGRLPCGMQYPLLHLGAASLDC